MLQKTATITGNQHISGACYKMTLASPDIAACARPGQFVMVRPGGGLKPFLPRPFSIHRLDPDGSGFALLYRIVGDGTRLMAALSAGDTLAVVGPLGKGFQLDQPFKNIALVAGGIGVAPLVFLAETLAAKAHAPVNAQVFIGGATADEVLCRDEFERLKMEVQVSTDDGSSGYRGFVTELLEKTIIKNPPAMVFACGPPAMLRAVAKITAAGNIPCQVSIETLMACGIGACLGCAVKPSNNTNGYLHACRDGPVFFTTEIDFNGLVHD
jgi:dihydroorotate dehydrogenase electron transfer subunit